MVLPLTRRHAFVPVPAAGSKVCYLGDSISDKWNTQGGVTMGKYRDAIDATFGWTRVGEGINALDYARGGITGRVASNTFNQQLAGGNASIGGVSVPVYVADCLTFLPDIVVLELGTNDWYFSTDASAATHMTPTDFGNTLDTLLPALAANTAVASAQSLYTTGALTSGSYNLVQNGVGALSIAWNATIAQINTALSGVGIPFTAVGINGSTAAPFISGSPLGVLLLANTTGAKGPFTVGGGYVGGTITPNTTTGTTGGTPAVKLIVVVGISDHRADAMNGYNPTSGSHNFASGLNYPDWASSLADAYWQFETTLAGRAKKWHMNNGVPIVYVPMRDMPHAYTVDNTHPTDPQGSNYYSTRITRVLTMGD